MTDKTTAEIAAEVSMLMQIDRNHREIATKVDMAALAGLPTHIAAVFESANAVGSDLTPTQAYALVNKRIAQVEAQLYLMRLELENRDPRDPASVYEDPMVISAYGERIAGLGARKKSFSFGPEILAEGWYPMEVEGHDAAHRWMRPGDSSLACVPHLGPHPQVLTIKGYVMHEDQLDGFTVSAAGRQARIEVTESGKVTRFDAILELSGEDVKHANYLPVSFRMDSFKPPNAMDSRLLGANIQGFTCASADAGANATDTPK